MSKILIENALIVNDGKQTDGYILIDGEFIAGVGSGKYTGERPETVIDATEKLVMPGVIDDQVHFREPGLTYKADIRSESISAVAGGVTSYMEMPNTFPQTTTIDLLNEKFDLAAGKSAANYSFYLGATNDNIEQVKNIDPKRVCGVKVFMGSSTGGMLVDSDEILAAIFSESPVIVTAHCEDETIIRKNLEYYKGLYGNDIDPYMHPVIRSAEACYVSSAKAAGIADKYGADLHILHVSTEKEMSLFEARPLADKKITCEVCVHHLWFSDKDYKRKKNLIKWNPAIKKESDRLGLINGIREGKVDIIATDHAPHTIEEKKKKYLEAPSGGPLVQHSLPVMLELLKKGDVTLNNVIKKMCHAPADRFKIDRRGYIREGYYADIVIVDMNKGWEVESGNILYKCGWSPFEETRFTTKVTHTIINGHVVYENGKVDSDFRGKELKFKR